jgi:hypothetical protein
MKDRYLCGRLWGFGLISRYADEASRAYSGCDAEQSG